MNRRSIGFILLLFGLLLMIGAGILAVGGIRNTVKSFQSLVTLAGPGEAEVLLEETGTYTLWHDNITFHNGVSVNQPPALPAGYSFHLENLDTGTVIPRSPTSGSMTRTVNNRESSRVGSFEVPDPGPHRLVAENPGGEVRIFSLSQGTFGQAFKGIGQTVLCGFVGFLGLALVVTGVILMPVGRKKAGPPTLPAT